MVYITRHTLLHWWGTTNGGLRGIFHANLSESQKRWRKSLFNAMPDEIRPFSSEKLPKQLQNWAIETGAKDLNGTVPIWWIGQRSNELQQAKARHDETLLIYLTGGGYMISSCHPAVPMAQLMQDVMKQFSTYKGDGFDRLPKSAVTVEYRKSGQAPTPCALMDCLALYRYLLEDLQFDANNIVIMGDSAGGHLVNSLIRFAQDTYTAIPKASVLINPWTDQAGTITNHLHSSFQRNEPYDVLSDNFIRLCRDTFAMHFNEPKKTLLDVYFSPCSIIGKVTKNGKPLNEGEEKTIFQNWPRTFLIGCYGDIMFDQTTEMYRRLALSKRAENRDSEEDLSIHLMEGSHGPFILPPFVFKKDRAKALKVLCEWVAHSL